MSRAHNFCAGPASLPTEVLEQAAAEMLDYQGRGLSVMEMSHRSSEYQAIADEAEKDFRELLNISDDYAVLFLQGGASLQFAMVPMNIRSANGTAAYVNTGQWSAKAIAEAGRYCQVQVVASNSAKRGLTIPLQEEWEAIAEGSAYLHYTPNETIGGLEYDFIPEVDVPLVADYSSSILSAPLDVNRYGVIYAGAQKNIGPAGLVIAIVRKDLLGNAHAHTPTLLDYSVHAKHGSMYHTPPTYSWYLAGLVFKWLKQQGGLSAMAEINARKVAKLYTYIDNSGFYSTPVEKRFRSRMNVLFMLADAKLDAAFLEGANAARLLNLKGHRSVGGMRASIYNAVPEAAVDALIDYMKDFAQKNG